MNLNIIVIVLLGIVPLSIIAVSGMHETHGEVTVQRVCSMDIEGGYDCSENWAMVYYHNMSNIQTPEEKWVSGFGIIGDYADGEKYSVCRFFPIVRTTGEENCSIKWFAIGTYKRDACYDGICYPLVWHEMKHLMCECKWHENMTSTSVFRNVIVDKTGNV